MVNRTQLAMGQVTESDWLIVELTKTRDGREVAVIIWPSQPTRLPARKLADTVARTCRVLANGSVELAARHGRKRW
jgi:hypothetical protein